MTACGPPPAFDAEFRGLFETMPRLIPKMTDAVRLAGRATPLIELDELTLDGAFVVTEVEGNGVPLTVARNAGADGPTPCLYFLHPGGMVAGDRRSAAVAALTHLALPLGLTVVSAGYRLAPDVRAPTLAEDAYAGLTWLVERAESLAVDAQRIIVMGISGGGGVAASCALLARDRGGPPIQALLLMYAMLDDRNETPSSHQMAEVGVWRRDDNAYAWQQVLGDRRGADDVNGYEAPARASDLSGLPPTYLDAGSAETFRDEIVDFAHRVWLAGGAADLHVWDGAFHGFDLAFPDAQISRASWQTKRDWIKRQLR